MTQKVVIIGHGFTSRLAVLRSVAQIGCEVTVIVMTGYKRFCQKLDTTKPEDCYSKYVSHVHYCYNSDANRLLNILLEECIDQQQKVILIPISDFSAAVIDENQEKLKDHFLFPHIHHQSGAIVAWMDKIRQKQLAIDVGMNVTDSCVVNVTNHLFTLPEGIKYPCFTKPLTSIEGGKRCLKRSNNEEELRDVLTKAGSKFDIRVLVEDFKSISTEYAVLGYSDGIEVIIPAVVKFITGSKSHPGIAMQGEIMPTTGFEDIISKFKEYVRQIGFVGIFDIDFFESEGKLYFGELNLRFGGSGSAVSQMGVNLPGMLVKALRGDSIDEMNKEVNNSAIYVNDRMCMDDWYMSYITTKQYHKYLQTADITFVKDNDDPAPYAMMKKEYRRTYIKRIIRKLARKTKILR